MLLFFNVIYSASDGSGSLCERELTWQLQQLLQLLSEEIPTITGH